MKHEMTQGVTHESKRETKNEINQEWKQKSIQESTDETNDVTKYMVIKCGGSVLEQLQASFYEQIVQIAQSRSVQPIIVHGGGPFISEALQQHGVETMFANGLRVTTREVLDTVEMVLSGATNKQIVRQLFKAGGIGFGISGVDGHLLKAKPSLQSEQLGFVGEVHSVNHELLQSICAAGYIPVVSPIAMDEAGQHYNVNADSAAAAIAQALQSSLLFVSNIPGVYREGAVGTGETHQYTQATRPGQPEQTGQTGGTKRSDKHDRDDENRSIYTQLTVEDIEALIRRQVITGGMIPKVRAATKAFKEAGSEVTIISGLEQNSLIHFCEGKNIGTKIVGVNNVSIHQ